MSRIGGNRKVALVTGASSNLGQKICELLKCEYDLVAVSKTKNASNVQMEAGVFSEGASLLDIIYHDDGLSSVMYIQADLTTINCIQEIFRLIEARFGRLDVVVNLAADTRFYGEPYEAKWYRAAIIDQYVLNALTPMLIIGEAHNRFWKHDREMNNKANRSVVNVSSGSAVKVYPGGQATYSMSKAALDMLSRHCCQFLKTNRVRINTAHPGAMNTDLLINEVAERILGFIQSADEGKTIYFTSNGIRDASFL